MSDKDEHEQQDEQREQEDLAVSEEQADEVEGGAVKVRFGADRDPKAARIRY